MDRLLWQTPPSRLQLEDEYIHVWAISLDVDSETLAQARRWLSRSEHRWMRRIASLRDQDRFIAHRGAIRQILSQYLPIAPDHLRLIHGVGGKPKLTQSCGGSELSFNVAHSAGLALLAIGHENQIGIDVELLRPIQTLPLIAAQFLSPRESRALQALPEIQRAAAFLQAWTRKAAYLKAAGLKTSPNSIEEPGTGAGSKLETASQWHIQSLTPALNYVGAVATRGPALKIKFWQWPPPADPKIFQN